MITSSLLITILVAVLLFVFRAEVRKLVDWIISFKRVSRTSEGFSIEATQPDVAPVEEEKREQAIVVAQPARSLSASEPKKDEKEDTWTLAYKEKRYDDAIRLLDAELQKTTDLEKQILTKSIIAHIKFQQNTAEGPKYFEQLIRDLPKDFQPYEWYALTYQWRGLFEKAISVVDRGLELAESKAQLWRIKSDCLAALGHESEAITAASKSVEADPSDADGYIKAAQIHQRRGEIEAARVWYKRGLAATNASESIVRVYARFLSENGLNEEAVLRYEDLVARQPANPEYNTLLGNAYLNAGFNNLALETYKKGDELAQGEQGWIVANIGNILKNQGLFTEAVARLKKAVELEPESQYAHERLAQAQKLESDEAGKLSDLLRRAKQEVSEQSTPKLTNVVST